MTATSHAATVRDDFSVPAHLSQSVAAARGLVGASPACLLALGGCYAPSLLTTNFESAVHTTGFRTGAPPYSENGNWGINHERDASRNALSQWRHRFPAGAASEQFRALVIDSGYVCEPRAELGSPYDVCSAEGRFRRETCLFCPFQNTLVRLRIVLTFERDRENIILTGYNWQNLGELN